MKKKMCKFLNTSPAKKNIIHEQMNNSFLKIHEKIFGMNSPPLPKGLGMGIGFYGFF